MFDKEFFPTPISVSKKMWGNLSDCSCVLEPSAGKGDLLEHGKMDRGLCFPEWGGSRRVDVIEKNPELQMILKGKGYNLIHDDFLSFVSNRAYDGIIMNPPFSDGVDHILKAWEISYGTVVCLLNAETVTNVCTKKRALLAAIIEEHGRVEFLGDCFSDSERKTNVDVAMVVLRRDRQTEEFGFFDDIATDRAPEVFTVPEAQENGLALNQGMIPGMVRMYKEARAAYKELIRAKNKVLFYSKPISEIGIQDLFDSHKSDIEQVNAFVDTINGDCWRKVFDKSNIERFITTGVSAEFEDFKGTNKIVDFTEDNVRNLLCTLGMSAGSIFESALVKVFDDLTRYNKKNVVHIEGWKTNDSWRVNKRVIIPYVIESDFSNEPSFHYGYQRGLDTIGDLDKVLCNLSGKSYADILTTRAAMLDAFQTGEWDAPCESEFFSVKFFKKGTVHLLFRDLLLLEVFNCAAAKGKKWLPENE